MTVKLALLKSGEDVVADLQEMVVKTPEGQDKMVGYIFKNPCIVKLVSGQQQTEPDQAIPFKIQLQPWMPLSKNKNIPVVPDWVVTITEPVDELVNTYERLNLDSQTLEGEENELEFEDLENLGADEQSDVVNAD